MKTTTHDPGTENSLILIKRRKDGLVGGPSLILVGALLLGIFLPSTLRADGVEDELRAMRQEIERLRQEVDSLREELRQVKVPASEQQASSRASQASTLNSSLTATNPPPSESSQEPSASDIVPLLQAQVAEHAQTKVESNSKLPVKIFGSLVSQTFFNSGEVNWLDSPNIVQPTPQNLPMGTFGFSLRQSRVGAIVEGPTIGSMKARGLVAVDFLGSNLTLQSNDQIGVPRLLYGFVRLEGEKTTIEVGQDQMILAPRNPTSLAALAFPELYRSGNLYYYAPQIRVERRFEDGNRREFEVTAGVLAPIGQYAAYEPGERARQPAIQSRLAWRQKPAAPGEEPAWEIGFSGHYGRERFTTELVESWATAGDFNVQHSRLGLAGEIFVGRNLASLGGGVGQSGKAAGGFLEARLKAATRLEFNTGVGTDRLFDLRNSLEPLARNSGLFANTIFHFTPELAASIEYRWLSTVPRTEGARRNNHLDLVVAYSF